ncbi:hypothetical protein fHeYen902_289 [Yersinia phage fHe-Yen9-02]|nr:hypothetical protein fHeYen902_289 [Yersinia phage fHe-Yen9-02]
MSFLNRLRATVAYMVMTTEQKRDLDKAYFFELRSQEAYTWLSSWQPQMSDAIEYLRVRIDPPTNDMSDERMRYHVPIDRFRDMMERKWGRTKPWTDDCLTFDKEKGLH